MSNTVIIGCKKNDCSVLKSGECLVKEENPRDCQFVELKEPAEPAAQFLQVSKLAAYSIDEAITFLNDQRANVVTLAGRVGAGKTSLLGSLILHFMDSSNGIGQHKFVDSNTLMAFLRRHYYADEASQNLAPDQPRTPTDENEVLHLTTMTGGVETHHLFVDLSGELCEQRLQSQVTYWNDLPFLKRTNYFVVLVDLKRLEDFNQRQKVKHDTVSLIEKGMQSVLRKDCILMILFSKADSFGKSLEASEFVTIMENELRARFANHFRGVHARHFQSLGNDGARESMEWLLDSIVGDSDSNGKMTEDRI